MTVEPNQEKSNSDELVQTLAQLSVEQIRFVVARQEYATDKEAAKAIGIKPDTVYQWRNKGYPIDEAVRLMVYDGLTTAIELRRRSLAKAMTVKIKGLDEDDDRLRQSVATEIIEWEMGRAAQRTEVTGKGGGPVRQELSGAVAVQVYIPDNERGDRDPTTDGATGDISGDSG